MRKILKGIYYRLFRPALDQSKHELRMEMHSLHQVVWEETQMTRAEVRQVHKALEELHRLHQLDLQLRQQLSQHVGDEFVKMYNLIEEIRCGRDDLKLNVVLVDELVKIHTALESLKHSLNGH